MTRSAELEIKVGIFVTIGIVLTLFTIMLLGGAKGLFERSLTYKAKFNQVEGLVEGATVKVSGVRVGQVKKINLIPDTAQIEVVFSVSKDYGNSIHEDATVGIQTQGVLGDRYIVVNPGTAGTGLAKDGTELVSEVPKELKDYLSNADEVLDRVKNSMRHLQGILGSFDHDGRADKFFKNLTDVSVNLSSATNQMPTKMKDFHASMGHLRSILAKVDNGQGTLGALVNDPSLYDDVKALLGGANRNKVLKYFIKKSVDSSREEATKQ